MVSDIPAGDGKINNLFLQCMMATSESFLTTVQVVGRHFQEELVLTAMEIIQDITNYHAL